MKQFHLLSKLALLLCFSTSLSNAQSLQWSQFTSPLFSSTLGTNATTDVKRAADGSIYALGYGRAGVSPNMIPTFPTTDLVVYGNGFTSSGPICVFLYKYSSDGSTLLWVRVLSSEGSNPGISVDLDINPTTGEVVVLSRFRGEIANSLITANAWQPNPPNFNQINTVRKNAFVLNKFSPSGNLVYGSYIGPTGGALDMSTSNPGTDGTPQTMKVAADGTIYLSFYSKQIKGQTGVIPTTPGAIATSGSPDPTSSASHLMIFNNNNTLRYSTYISGTLDSSPEVRDEVLAPNGDLYVGYIAPGFGASANGGGNSSIAGFTMPANAAVPTTGKTGMILRFNSAGQIIGGTYLPQTLFGNLAYFAAIARRPNGNIIATTDRGDFVEFNANLTTLISHNAPVSGKRMDIRDMDVDDTGRIHFISLSSEGNSNPTTSGALEGADNTRNAGYYGIVDCDGKTLVYGTNISQGAAPTATTLLSEIELDGCSAYIVGNTYVGTGFPVTPTAYNDAGTATVSGYDISASETTLTHGVLLAFNYPAQKAGTNVLTTPAITNFCAGGGILPIGGSKTTFITPTVIGKADASPVPTPTHYQWQVATTNAGPWTNIADSDVEDFAPTAPVAGGNRCYRRLVRQTPFGKGFCVPTCDETNISNVICLTFSTSKTHATNISNKKYAICKKGTALSIPVNITQSPDGAFGPYSYKLTTISNLTTTALGQSGSVASAPGPINLSVGVVGDYILQVTDSRGCTSFDTLNVENLILDAGEAEKFTCGLPTVQIGPISLPPDYANFATNTFVWSPATGLNNPNAVSPTFTHGLAAGASTKKYLTFNGCLVDSVKITNQAITPLPSLPALSLCQGDTLRLGTSGPGTASLLTAQSGVTYEWAPGLGLVSNDVVNPVLTTASAPAGVNVTTYTLLATAGNTGCVQTTTQKVTVYRSPNQSFQIKNCMENGCGTTKPLAYSYLGTNAEPGISYTWDVIIVPKTATTGVPTKAQALAALQSPNSASTALQFATNTLGRANATYQLQYIRSSFNTANSACARKDTAFLDYCVCGSGQMCALALGAVPTISCGGTDNKIGPSQYSSSGRYVWSRLDGQPLNNELFEVGTNLPLVNGGPHSNQVIANPSGVVAISYRLTLYNTGGDTCRLDIKVFPGAVSKPTVSYPSPQAVCRGNNYVIQGPAGQPALVYAWTAKSAFLTPADTAKALPTIKGLSGPASVYVTVTDPSTGCSVKDTVKFAVTPVDVIAGTDATFCQSGATVDIGGNTAIQGYTYAWTAVPATGVTFANATKPTTKATLPAKAVGGKITLYLKATNGLTAANCMLSDSVVFTSAAAPVISIPTPDRLCTGGTVKIGAITPTGATTYTWTPSTGIVSGQGTTVIIVDATGTYSVKVDQGTCSATKTVTVSAVTNPTVTPNPAAPCATDATIGVNNLTTAALLAGWEFSWDKYDGLTDNANDFSTITVRPTVATTYTLTATHSSGCTKTFSITVPAATYVATLPSTLNFCEGQPAVLPLNNPSAVSGTVVWTASPTSALAYLSSSTVVNPTVNTTTAPAGQYTYTATVSYGSGCKSVATTTVNVGKKIANLAGLDQEICEGTCVNLGITAITGMSYDWSADPADATLLSSNSATPKVCPKVNTTYKVKYVDAAGCQNTDDVFIKVNAAPVLDVKDIKSCQNATGTATMDLNTAIVSNTGTSTTFWQNAGATVAATNPVRASTTYYIKSANASGCFVVLPVQVTININPFPSFTLAQTNVTCNGATNGKIIVTITGGATPFTYSIDDGITFPNTDGIFQNLAPATYKIAVKDANGCVKKCN